MSINSLYAEKSANYPRIFTDRFFVNENNQYSFGGVFDRTVHFLEKAQLIRPDLWKRFVDQYRQEYADADEGWRGEYWGKMMRGACFVYSYSRLPELYAILKETVSDMLASAKEDGRISTYSPEKAFRGWDIWCRKYVMLGMQYFLEICEEPEFADRILVSLQGQADQIMSHIGPEEEGKIPITETSGYWRGLNSSSLLEPIVRLYSLTKQQKYLDFASYIVSCGGIDCINLFDMAYENKLPPYQYPITKAYEMISCFEGLVEYYRITGNEKHRKALIQFVDRILATDFTVTGGCGCSEELFDHSTVRQANTTNDMIMQETCVTVTLMKFMYQMLILTGDPRYADAIEISFYNAYLGSINTEGAIEKTVKENPDLYAEPLPFDSYSPLTAGRRGNRIGGLKVMTDHHYYGCCACIGSAGIGVAAKIALLSTADGFAYSLFFPGTIASYTPKGNQITFKTETEYPIMGHIRITLSIREAEQFNLLVRIPAWSQKTEVKINGASVDVHLGYLSLSREWKNGDIIDLDFDMRTRAVYPQPYGHDILMTNIRWKFEIIVPSYDEEDPLAHCHIALCRGPLTMAQENRLGYFVDDPVTIKVQSNGIVDAEIPKKEIAPYPHMIELSIPTEDGSTFRVTDYASAGKTFSDESRMAAWILTKEKAK